MNVYKSEDFKDEIELLQLSITRYDDLSFKIKGWAIALWTAVLTLGFNLINEGIIVISISVFIAILFWVLDGMFKLYQRAFIARLKAIQNYLKNPTEYNEKFGKIYSYDLNFRLGRFNNEKSIRFYFKTTRISKCLFVRNIWVIYYWFIAIGTLVGLLIESVDINDIIWYITYCLTIFIIMYVFLGDMGFHETKFKSFARIKGEKINFIIWFQFLKFIISVVCIVITFYFLSLFFSPIVNDFFIMIRYIFESLWIIFLFTHFIIFRWWISNKSTNFKNWIRKGTSKIRIHFSTFTRKN